MIGENDSLGTMQITVFLICRPVIYAETRSEWNIKSSYSNRTRNPGQKIEPRRR